MFLIAFAIKVTAYRLTENVIIIVSALSVLHTSCIFLHSFINEMCSLGEERGVYHSLLLDTVHNRSLLGLVLLIVGPEIVVHTLVTGFPYMWSYMSQV
jgi:hypothetical protein